MRRRDRAGRPPARRSLRGDRGPRHAGVSAATDRARPLPRGLRGVLFPRARGPLPDRLPEPPQPPHSPLPVGSDVVRRRARGPGDGLRGHPGEGRRRPRLGPAADDLLRGPLRARSVHRGVGRPDLPGRGPAGRCHLLLPGGRADPHPRDQAVRAAPADPDRPGEQLLQPARPGLLVAPAGRLAANGEVSARGDRRVLRPARAAVCLRPVRRGVVVPGRDGSASTAASFPPTTPPWPRG